MNIVVFAIVVGAVLVLAAQQFNRNRRPEPPTQQGWTVPQQLDRDDFDRPEAPWIMVVFTSATCHSCAKVGAMAEVLRSEVVGVDIVDYQTKPDTHKRYGIDAVPTTVIADQHGVVVKSFVGPTTATDLWAAMAEAREPGSTPPPEAHHPKTTGPASGPGSASHSASSADDL